VSETRRFWRISPGKHHFQWVRGTWQRQKVISIGWEEFGNLEQYNTVAAIKTAAQSRNFKKPGYVADQLWAFKQVKEGHIAVAYGNYTILDIGLVNGSYFLRLDGLVEPYYDLYGHRIPVVWLKIGPVPIQDEAMKKYLSANNTIFEITDHATLGFIQQLLAHSLQYRVQAKIVENIVQDKPDITLDFDEDALISEIKKSDTLFKNNPVQRIDIDKELGKLELEKAPDKIQTKGRVGVRMVPTITASANLGKIAFNGMEIYAANSSAKEIAEKAEEIRAFQGFIIGIIDKMAPNKGEHIALISFEDSVRDAYRYHGRTVFNFNRYLEEKSRFFWFFVAARELAYLIHNQLDYRHNNLMRCLLIEGYNRGF